MAIVNQTNARTVSKASLEKRMRDGLECTWVFTSVRRHHLELNTSVLVERSQSSCHVHLLYSLPLIRCKQVRCKQDLSTYSLCVCEDVCAFRLASINSSNDQRFGCGCF